jgi:hypothetical protein
METAITYLPSEIIVLKPGLGRAQLIARGFSPGRMGVLNELSVHS